MAGRLVIEIDMKTEAFKGGAAGHELGRILRLAAYRCEGRYTGEEYGEVLRDVHGDAVGNITVTP